MWSRESRSTYLSYAFVESALNSTDRRTIIDFLHRETHAYEHNCMEIVLSKDIKEMSASYHVQKTKKQRGTLTYDLFIKDPMKFFSSCIVVDRIPQMILTIKPIL